MTNEELINWDVAAAAGKKVVRGGPQIPLKDAVQVVAQLRAAALSADEHVARITQIQQPAHSAPTLVVDRPGWIDLNATSISTLMDPLVRKLALQNTTSAVGRAIGSRVTGAEAGAVMGFLASRVLGQFDIFGPATGQLLLVAPNIVEAERKLDVDPADFRLWVCLHEVTHRLQFTAFPWLSDYLRAQVATLIDESDLDADSLKATLSSAVAAIRERRQNATKNDAKNDGKGILSLLQSPAQKEILDRMTAVMSLLEGHAEYVMDEVGPSVVPSVASIRAKFKRRRAGRSPIDRLFRKVLGLEAKMKQYANGRIFVDGVVGEVGMAGFNVVWTSPQTLPTVSELTSPQDWVARVRPTERLTAP